MNMNRRKQLPGRSVNVAALPPPPIDCSGYCAHIKFALDGGKPMDATVNLRGRRQGGNNSRFLLLSWSLEIDGRQIMAHSFVSTKKWRAK